MRPKATPTRFPRLRSAQVRSAAVAHARCNAHAPCAFGAHTRASAKVRSKCAHARTATSPDCAGASTRSASDGAAGPRHTPQARTLSRLRHAKAWSRPRRSSRRPRHATLRPAPSHHQQRRRQWRWGHRGCPEERIYWQGVHAKFLCAISSSRGVALSTGARYLWRYRFGKNLRTVQLFNTVQRYEFKIS